MGLHLCVRLCVYVCMDTHVPTSVCLCQCLGVYAYVCVPVCLLSARPLCPSGGLCSCSHYHFSMMWLM